MASEEQRASVEGGGGGGGLGLKRLLADILPALTFTAAAPVASVSPSHLPMTAPSTVPTFFHSSSQEDAAAATVATDEVDATQLAEHAAAHAHRPLLGGNRFAAERRRSIQITIPIIPEHGAPDAANTRVQSQSTDAADDAHRESSAPHDAETPSSPRYAAGSAAAPGAPSAASTLAPPAQTTSEGGALISGQVAHSGGSLASGAGVMYTPASHVMSPPTSAALAGARNGVMYQRRRASMGASIMSPLASPVSLLTSAAQSVLQAQMPPAWSSSPSSLLLSPPDAASFASAPLLPPGSSNSGAPPMLGSSGGLLAPSSAPFSLLRMRRAESLGSVPGGSDSLSACLGDGAPGTPISHNSGPHFRLPIGSRTTSMGGGVVHRGMRRSSDISIASMTDSTPTSSMMEDVLAGGASQSGDGSGVDGALGNSMANTMVELVDAAMVGMLRVVNRFQAVFDDAAPPAAATGGGATRAPPSYSSLPGCAVGGDSYSPSPAGSEQPARSATHTPIAQTAPDYVSPASMAAMTPSSKPASGSVSTPLSGMNAEAGSDRDAALASQSFSLVAAAHGRFEARRSSHTGFGSVGTEQEFRNLMMPTSRTASFSMGTGMGRIPSFDDDPLLLAQAGAAGAVRSRSNAASGACPLEEAADRAVNAVAEAGGEVAAPGSPPQVRSGVTPRGFGQAAGGETASNTVMVELNRDDLELLTSLVDILTVAWSGGFFAPHLSAGTHPVAVADLHVAFTGAAGTEPAGGRMHSARSTDAPAASGGNLVTVGEDLAASSSDADAAPAVHSATPSRTSSFTSSHDEMEVLAPASGSTPPLHAAAPQPVLTAASVGMFLRRASQAVNMDRELAGLLGSHSTSRRPSFHTQSPLLPEHDDGVVASGSGGNAAQGACEPDDAHASANVSHASVVIALSSSTDSDADDVHAATSDARNASAAGVAAKSDPNTSNSAAHSPARALPPRHVGVAATDALSPRRTSLMRGAPLSPDFSTSSLPVRALAGARHSMHPPLPPPLPGGASGLREADRLRAGSLGGASASVGAGSRSSTLQPSISGPFIKSARSSIFEGSVPSHSRHRSARTMAKEELQRSFMANPQIFDERTREYVAGLVSQQNTARPKEEQLRVGAAKVARVAALAKRLSTFGAPGASLLHAPAPGTGGSTAGAAAPAPGAAPPVHSPTLLSPTARLRGGAAADTLAPLGVGKETSSVGGTQPSALRRTSSMRLDPLARRLLPSELHPLANMGSWTFDIVQANRALLTALGHLRRGSDSSVGAPVASAAHTTTTATPPTARSMGEGAPHSGGWAVNGATVDPVKQVVATVESATAPQVLTSGGQSRSPVSSQDVGALLASTASAAASSDVESGTPSHGTLVRTVSTGSSSSSAGGDDAGSGRGAGSGSASADATESNCVDIPNSGNGLGSEMLVALTSSALEQSGVVAELGLDRDTIHNFLARIARGYHNQPYHNALHAADVTQAAHYILTTGGLGARLKPEYRLAVLLGAAVHDVGHPGLNNIYLSQTAHPLALTYNDRSPLENMHAASAFLSMRRPGCDILAPLSADSRTTLRGIMIDMILATDNAHHFKLVGKLRRRIARSRRASVADGHVSDDDYTSSDDGLHDEAAPASDAITYGLDTNKLSDVRLLLQATLHACDISNPSREFKLYNMWTDRITEEFWVQGDKLREFGAPVPSMHDRSNPIAKPKMQAGFITALVLPLWQCLVDPTFAQLMDVREIVLNLKLNLGTWTSMIQNEEAASAAKSRPAPLPPLPPPALTTSNEASVTDAAPQSGAASK